MDREHRWRRCGPIDIEKTDILSRSCEAARAAAAAGCLYETGFGKLGKH
jgi:hypothetical protein